MVVVALLAGCGGGGRDEALGGVGAWSGTEAVDTGNAPLDGSETDGGSEAGGEGPKLDVGPGAATQGPGDGGSGCTKIDFLFVIDHSASMGSYQENLAASFPGFIETIESSAGVDDNRIMVIDTDPWGAAIGRGDYNQQNGPPLNGINCSPDPQCCDPAAGSCAEHPSLPCNGNVCLLPSDECDYTVGAAWDKQYPTLQRCPIDGPQRFIEEGQPDLLATFECIAKIGTWGNGDEQVMEALVAALSPELLGAEGCNAGFVRDDALLVITFISDSVPASSWEQNDPDPGGWAQSVVAAKNGVAEAVVVLGLIADDSVGYREFIEQFGARGFEGSVTAPDYAPFFVDAVDAAGGISDACDSFEPVG